jgi:L-lactate dehydrogenase complex protein LldG
MTAAGRPERSGAAEMTAREQILGRIRGALADVPGDDPACWNAEGDRDPATAYARAGQRSGEPLVELFVERCGDYRAVVSRCGAEPPQIAAAVLDACERQGATGLMVAPGLDRAWLPDGIGAALDDPPLSLAELDGGGAALTTCAVAIALTGTIALDSGAGQGRRALTLVPDVHICVVRAGQIVEGVPEAIRRLQSSVDSGRPVTLISGPSATSDIELKRVEGVHGPRRLEVVVAA